MLACSKGGCRVLATHLNRHLQRLLLLLFSCGAAGCCCCWVAKRIAHSDLKLGKASGSSLPPASAADRAVLR
jgi:hypothetical protein